jgi:nucleoside-diphosphate-sugar epimerase
MSNTMRLWAPMIRAERVVRYITPDAVSVAVHEADIAAVGVVALLEDGHTGKAYDMTGPERITVRQQVAAIGAALGEEVRFEEVSALEAKEILTRQGGWGAENADFLLGLEDYTPGAEMPQFTAEEWDQMLQPMPTVEEVTGRPARTYAQWARDNVEKFR